MKNFSGKVLFLDRSDINTDEIIPAKYLSEISKEVLKPYLLEDLQLDGFSPDQDIEGKNIIITKANFGCGSSREHAPWVLESNGINLIIAESFARIFRQNMFNCGMMAVALPAGAIDSLFKQFSGKNTFLEPQKRAHSPQLAVGLASESENSKLPYGRRFPAACCVELQTDLQKNIFIVKAGELTEEISFKISDFERALVDAGGWVEYADSRY